MQNQLKTAEQWREFEERLTNDPANLAQIVAHVHQAPDHSELGARLLALRATADIRLQMEPRSLTERQKIRWNAYTRFLENHRERLRKLKANPDYKTRRQQRTERERLIYIRHCQRTGEPIYWETVEMHWNKSLGRIVGVRIYPDNSP